GAPLRPGLVPLLQHLLLVGGQRLLRRHLVLVHPLPDLALGGLAGHYARLAALPASGGGLLTGQVELALGLAGPVALQAVRQDGSDLAVEVRRGGEEWGGSE